MAKYGGTCMPGGVECCPGADFCFLLKYRETFICIAITTNAGKAFNR